MVYLITNDKGKVKIGFTGKGGASRLNSLQTGNPDKLYLVWETYGTLQMESILHHYLQNYRSSGEWFNIKGCEHILYYHWAIIFTNTVRDCNIVDFGSFVVDLYIFSKYNLIHSLDIEADLEKLRKKNLLTRDVQCDYIRYGRSVTYYQERTMTDRKQEWKESSKDVANNYARIRARP